MITTPYKTYAQLRAEFDEASIAMSEAVDEFDRACKDEILGIISLDDVNEKYEAQMNAYERLQEAFSELQKRQN